MKYIVHGKTVSKDIYYFCLDLQEKNKTFALINFKEFHQIYGFINNHPEFDYYIHTDWNNYDVKTKEIVGKYFEKDRCLPVKYDELLKRYQKSKLKDTLTFEQWYTKYNWTLCSDSTYETENFKIPKSGNYCEDPDVKLFSEIVEHEDTVSKLNELIDKEIQYVLRNYKNTEIIYLDEYLEIV